MLNKKRIIFFGDSITDMRRDRSAEIGNVFSYGEGYPFVVAGNFSRTKPNEYELVNSGISGNRVVDLYARIKSDVWNLEPDVLSVLIGINDIWHELTRQDGVDIIRFEKIYSMLIEDTLKVLPKVKIILLEPFVLKGSATEEQYDKFLQVKEYAKVVKKLAEKYKLFFVPLQDKFNEYAMKHGEETYLYDGVHPNVGGAMLIADEWIKVFNQEVEK